MNESVVTYFYIQRSPKNIDFIAVGQLAEKEDNIFLNHWIWKLTEGWGGQNY